MPPRRNTPPQVPDPDQGFLIEVGHKSNGLTDAAQQVGSAFITRVVEDGIYPDQAAEAMPEGVVSAEQVAIDGAKEAAKTQKRSEAQRGKHSPITRDGNYLSLRLGDYLPGYGAVTEKDWDNAKRHARTLEEARRQKLRDNPRLGEVLIADVERIISGTSDAFKMPTGKPKPEAPQSDEPLPKLDTLRSRLEVLIDGAREAKFVPMSKTEATVALGITGEISTTQKAGNRSGRGAVHNHLMETHDGSFVHVKRIKHYHPQVAEWYADRAVASRCYEIVDFFEDAAKSEKWLADFSKEMAEAISPAEKRALIEKSYHLAMGALVGFMTVTDLKSGRISEADLQFKPLTARKERTREMAQLPTARTVGEQEFARVSAEILADVKAASGNYTEDARYGRNKTLVMPFTDPKMPAETKEFIKKVVASIPAGKIDNLLLLARIAAHQRKEFWQKALQDVSGKYKHLVEPSLAIFGDINR